MAAAASSTKQDHPLCYDVKRPLDLKQVARGYHNATREYDYWVPEADIEGKVPRELHGTLLRNGPGLLEIYGKRLIHPIDGDGMIVALSFIDGRVHLRTRFVASKERQEEQHERKFIYRGQMGTHPRSALWDTASFFGHLLTLRWPALHYRNPSNTNVFYWGGKVISSYETGLPHTLDPHTLDTLGLDDFNGALKLKAFAAHFRLDMKNKRLVCMGLKPGVGSYKPTLVIYEFDERWTLLQSQVHHIQGLNYAHDFLLLPDYYVFHMTPFANMSWMSVLKVYMGWSSPGQLLQHYPHLPSRFIVIPRHKGAKHQEIRFMDTDPFHIFHFGIAEQKGDDIITFNAVCLGPKFNMTFENEIWLSNASVAPGNVFSFTLNLATSKCESSKGPVDPASVEFPTTHPYRHGVPNTRYSYLMASDRKGCNLPYRDVVKYDAQREQRQVWYSHGCVGEPVFVPRRGWDSWKEGDEDDGFVVVQLYVPELHRTEFVILDAKHVDRGPVTRIKLKHHIPYGFHGTFAPEVFVDSHCLPKAKL